MTTDSEAILREGHLRKQRAMVCILRDTIDRLERLEYDIRDFREQMARLTKDTHFCDSLDFELRELGSKRNALTGRASAYGEADDPERIPEHPRANSNPPDFGRGPSALAARLRVSSKACAKRLCALVRAARAVRDVESERIACALLHILEKLLCLLWPRAAPVDLNILSRISGQSQLMVCVL